MIPEVYLTTKGVTCRFLTTFLLDISDALQCSLCTSRVQIQECYDVGFIDYIDSNNNDIVMRQKF